MKLLVKIAALEFTTAVVIVAATRAVASGSYTKTGFYEVIFVAQWFWSRNLGFQDESRSWKTAFPAYAIGAVLGAWFGLWISK